MLLKAFQGFCMALADSVPGVSGGTVAFIMGFYENFIDALHALFGKDSEARKRGIIYLLRLGVGWIAGMVLSILLLSGLFTSHIYFLSSLFLGLTAASIPFIISEERNSLQGRYLYLLFTFIGMFIVIGLSALRQGSIGFLLDFAALSPIQAIYIFISGALAIAAMVLPGISGSTLLLIFGVYLPTISAVRSLLHLQLSVLPGIIMLALGILFGMAVSIKAIRPALKKYRPQMVYLILGLMVGSFYAIVMGPTTLSTGQPAMTFSTFSPLGFFLGIAVLIGLERLRLFCRTEKSVSKIAE